MAKTTKLVQGIHSWIKFQKHQGIESLTIEGKQALADLSQDKNGDTNLVLNADKDKINAVTSSVPFLNVTHTTTGTDPNQEKKATVSQNLEHFPLTGGELVTVTKEADSLTIHDDKVKEFVNKTVTTKETEIRKFIGTVKEELTNNINEHLNDSSSQATKTASFLGVGSITATNIIKDFSLKPNGDVELHGTCMLYINYISNGMSQSFMLPFYAGDTGFKNINGIYLQVKGVGSISIDITLPTVPTESLNIILMSYSSTKEMVGTLGITAIE